MDNKLTVGILTLGCKVNQYESEAIAEELDRRGFEVISCDLPCSAYIINTCTVTAESDRKARQMIRRMMSRNPLAYILVTGCYSQISPDDVSRIEGVDYVCGNSNKMSVVDKLCELVKLGEKNKSAQVSVKSISDAGFEAMSIKKFDRTRAYVKIEDGCESRCTYCTIPNARGSIRSKPFEEVINEVQQLVEGGCKEVVLTGIETGSYGVDLSDGEDLASLLCEIDKIDGLERVRLGSLDPTVIKPRFVDKIKGLKSLAPHFHLSLQSGSDKILASMKRKYNSRQAMRAVELLKDAIADVKFTTDIIVGFPGETEEDFEQSCDFARRAGFLMIHAFPYSKRKGTPAAEMKEQINKDIKHDRVKTLSKIGEEIRDNILEEKIKENKDVQVLFESCADGYASGHTADFVEVRVKTDECIHGQMRFVRLISHKDGICSAELVDL